MRQQPERALHKAVAEFLDLALPKNSFWWPTPNASKRTAAQAANMKRAHEFKPGIPDIFVLYRGELFGLELKSAKGRLSPDQVTVCWALHATGAHHHIVRSVKDVHDFLSLFIPLKAKVT
jgi:hypothetical protein